MLELDNRYMKLSIDEEADALHLQLKNQN